MPTILSADRPMLRYGLSAKHRGEEGFVIHDPLGIGQSVVLSPLALEVAERFDGQLTAAEIAAGIKSEYPEAKVAAEDVARLAEALDSVLLLNSRRLHEHLSEPVRKPACIGSYAAEPAALRQQLEPLFTAGGAGLPGSRSHSGTQSLRAVLVPHMDYGRGNITYGHGFRELIDGSQARTFVIIATSHYSPHRFALSRQHFDTPLGLVETDQEYVGRIAEQFGNGLFDDPVAHIPEHSIELEVVLLQFLLAGRRPFKIVPLLVGSIGDCVSRNAMPGEASDLARMVEALRAAESKCSEEVCYIISGDLAHIGPKFDDRRKAAGEFLEQSRAKDTAILKTLEAADPDRFYQVVAAEQNARRICGLSPTWLTLAVTRPRFGKVLHYQQYADPAGHESVSFAAAAFYG